MQASQSKIGGRFDCIVVGGGHNGLVCAAYLARSGRSVLVLEAGEQVGGASSTREFAPGFRVSAAAHLLYLMPERMLRELRLREHGLRFAGEDLPTTALDPQGSPLAIDPVRRESLTARSRTDAAAYPHFHDHLQRLARALRPLLQTTPPRLGTDSWRDRIALLRLGWNIRRLGRRDMRELLRIGGMCVQDLLDEQFETPLLKGALGFDAVLGTCAGPRSPGTVFSLLYRLAAASSAAGALRLPIGGLGTLAESLAASARAAGAVVRTGAIVERILVRSDRVVGISLASGETIESGTVISSADPKTTFLGLLGAEHLDAGFVRRIVNLRDAGTTAKLHLALGRRPEFSGVTAEALRGRLLLAPSLPYIERAYNHAKYGEFSSAPTMEITLPSVADPTMAMPDKHVLSAVVQYVPYAPKAGWQDQRASLIAHLIDTLERYAPGLRASVEAAELLTPADIEREFRIRGGHWHHAELALDQFFFVRPSAGAAQYQAPIEGLFLCGAGSHPGGGVMGVAGRNAAQRILRQAA